MGRIEEDILLPFPELPPEEKDLLEAVVASVDDLLGAHGEDFRSWDRAGEMPAEFIDELKQFGLFGLVVPEEYGGLGFGATAYSRTLQQIARHDASVAVTIGAHSSIGMRGLLLYGTEAQNARWMPALATGELIAAFCLTEPGAGSDAAAIRTTAVRDGDAWVINGQKLWITNGGIAQFFTVFCKSGDPDERKHTTAFIVTSDMPGVSVGPHEDKLGLRSSSTTTLFFDDVRVPADHMLGPIGEGFKVAMHILNSGRTGLGGGSVGAMKNLVGLASKQATGREQFGCALSEFGLIKQKVGQMVVDCYTAESTVNIVNGLIDRGHEEYAVEAAISKIYASEMLWKTADEALQVSGGNGYMCDYPYGRILRDCRINRIFEGANEVLRLFVALTAMNEVGQDLKELASSLQGIFDHPIKGFGVMSDYALRRAGYATGIGPEGTSFTQLVPEVSGPAGEFERATRKLAVAVDRVLRKHGKNIIGKQFASSRLANIMIDLFVLGCTLARVSKAIENHGAVASARELEILQVFTGQAIDRIDANFQHIDMNDDALVKSLADHAFDAGEFTWDNL